MDVKSILAVMKDRYAGKGRITDIDGVKIDFPDSWVHMRSSNTEPIIRIYAESGDRRSAEKLAADFMAEIQSLRA